MTMAKMLPEGDLSRQYLRYRKEADARFLKGHRALLAELARDAKSADNDDGEDGDDGAAAGVPGEAPTVGDRGAVATVTTAPADAPAAVTIDKVDSPNDPGNGRTATTVPPAAGNGLVVLVLLVVLLGQLLGGLGRVKAWAASLGAAQPRAASSSSVGRVKRTDPQARAFLGALHAPYDGLQRHPTATAPDLERRDL
jgi:hypothetical protein